MTNPSGKAITTSSSAVPMTPTFHPARIEMANQLATQFHRLDGSKPHPMIEKTKQAIREKMERLGMSYMTFEITDEPILDPRIASLPKADRALVDAVARTDFATPQALLAATEGLIKRFPEIPMLWNQKVYALNEMRDGEQAEATSAEMVRRFPRYLFGFCNHVLLLLHSDADRLDEARALVETGPRGPMYSPIAFDPSRTVFHVSEVATFATMAGRYLIATGRAEAASMQLRMLQDLDPDSPQTRSLAQLVRRAEGRTRAAITPRQHPNLKKQRARSRAKKAKRASKRGSP